MSLKELTPAMQMAEGYPIAQTANSIEREKNA
jgi:hypothetical protein